jgi:cystathionine beta-lyase/cystathionine gamma-synthase
VASKFDTNIIHAGEPRLHGAAVPPIFQSTVYEVIGEVAYEDLRYIRLSNLPNHTILGEKLAALESAEAGLVTGSGMSAITTTLLATLSAGDHLVAHDCLYGGTHSFIAHDLSRWGISSTFVDPREPDSWDAAVRPNTRAIYTETLSNPLLGVTDLDAVVALARKHDLVSIVDNTFATPVNYRPAEHGFDLSVHSATKYLNGHSDLVAGAVIGKRDRVQRVHLMLNHLGGTLDPHACFLLHRGMKTLGIRVQRQSETAAKIAHYLEAHPAVSRVRYPGLESHPQHALAARQLDGFGGMLSFELVDRIHAAAAQQMVESLQIFLCGPSLGGVESLVTRPAATSHAGMSAEERAATGITDTLVRLSVGIEDSEDLIEDLEQALGKL